MSVLTDLKLASVAWRVSGAVNLKVGITIYRTRLTARQLFAYQHQQQENQHKDDLKHWYAEKNDRPSLPCVLMLRVYEMQLHRKHKALPGSSHGAMQPIPAKVTEWDSQSLWRVSERRSQSPWRVTERVKTFHNTFRLTKEVFNIWCRLCQFKM